MSRQPRDPSPTPLSRFGVLVAQLESIAASARHQPPDPLLCFDLLSDLSEALADDTRESIVLWQRKCEDALHALLTLGARRPVRRLAAAAMVRVISRGDGISIYSRASTLQGWLSDCKRGEPLAVAGVSLCLGELYRVFGRRITSGLLETINISAKLMKFHEDFVRQDALQMLDKALEGSAGSGAPAAYSEAFRIIMRVGVNDKSFVIRLSAARCLKTFASIGGPGLGTVELESSIVFCIKALEDPSSPVRNAFAEALGTLLALVMHPQAQKGKIHSLPAKKLDNALEKHLKTPFIRASGFRGKDFRIGLTLSWISFLQVVLLKYQVPDSELQNYALQAMDMLQGNTVVNAHALACVLYILRVGVIHQMTEPTQRSFLVHLGKKLESTDYSPSVGVATLRILSYLLTTLGEVPVEFKDILDNTVIAAVSHASSHVRTEAALTLRALAEVDPTCVGGLISYGMTTLRALRETVSTTKGNHSNTELDSLHGQSSVLASLVSISPKLILGYPARLPKSVFEVSRKMVTDFSRNTEAATAEKQAGWLLLASLIASMPKEELEDQVFDVLLLWANPFVGNPDFLIRQTQDLPSELRVLSAAVEALTVFIRSFVTPISSTNAGILLQPVLAYLSGALSYISYLSANASQSLKPALELFIIRTLMAYQSISDPMAYKSEHSQIVKICTSPFSDPAGCEESSCLRLLLDKRDTCLGPWLAGRDWFEDELRAFDGGDDGLMPCVWDDEVSSFPQLEPIKKMLVNQKLLCFANIFATQDNGGKLILLNKIDQCLKSGKKQPWRMASMTNSCVGLLAGLKAVLAFRPQTLDMEILSFLQAIFQSILAEGETAQRRASAEGLGLVARLGSDIFTARLTRSLLGELAVATDPDYLGSVAFTLGCIHRCAGGMALSTLVPATVSSISLLAKSANANLQLWSLHALLLTIEAAGLSYVSQVQATLFLAIEILLLEESGLVDTRQEIGHLINAIVAVLGPELSPGSIFFSRCKAVVAEVSSCQETSTLLESVRFTQQLVLFAPRAVSVHSHVQSLLPTLSSKQPSLRYLAVSTLRHLIEKDPVAIIHEKIEESLFSMLDEETDTEIGGLVRETILRLLYTACPSCPSRWLAVLRKLVIATSTRSTISNIPRSENEQISGTSEDGATFYNGEDDEGMIASSDGVNVQGSVSSIRKDPNRDKHLRYRTKVFAAECLSYVPAAVGSDPAHFDLSLARSQSATFHASDWLVLHLQELVSLAYQISTGQLEGMQSIGVRLLSIVMDKFENTPDPEVPGHSLLEQYQAQFVSAVRSAISVSAGPLLLEAGLQLATKILRSSIISEDRVALSRMFSLISRPLNDINDLYYPSFAEWVACKIKVRLVSAHASIKCYVYQIMREQKVIPDEYQQLIPFFSSSSTMLGKYWISVLKDYTYICFGLHSKFNYVPFLDGIHSPLVSSKIKMCLDEAWPLILQATALDAVPVMPEVDKHSFKNMEELLKTALDSGSTMIRLESWDFQFLWGLALIILFQGQRVDLGKQQPLVTHRKRKHSADVVLQDTHLASGGISLRVFVSLTKEVFYGHKFLTLDLCKELIEVLIHVEYTAETWNRHVTCLMSQIVQLSPDEYFEKEEFVDAATELCFKHLLISFQSTEAASQQLSGFRDLLSEISTVAETIASRTSHKMNQLKLILASMSVSHELFRGASTDAALFKLMTFLQNIVPCLNKCFRVESNHGVDYESQVEKLLGTWASMLTILSQDCIKRIHSTDKKKINFCKFLAKMLAFCLEEAASLARLLHEKHHLGREKASNTTFAIFKNFTKCMRDTFYDRNIQVQMIGLLVLKNIAQRDLAEGSHVKDHSFVLFLIAELLGDIFLLIQHILKEQISRESIAVTEECLSLLFLFHTLSQTSECVLEVTVFLLEALHMVFMFSSSNHSRELNQVNNSTRRLVSHLVQIPSTASQMKEAMLSVSLPRRQQFQDMIRASVTPNPMVLQIKPNVLSDPNAREDRQVHASDFVAPLPNKHDAHENSDDDEDWDAFQSIAVNEIPSPSDSFVDMTAPEADLVDECLTGETNHNHEEHSDYMNVPLPMVSLETCEQKPEAYTDNESTNTKENEVEVSSLPRNLEDHGTIDDEDIGNDQHISRLLQPNTDSASLVTDEQKSEACGSKGMTSNATNEPEQPSISQHSEYYGLTESMGTGNDKQVSGSLLPLTGWTGEQNLEAYTSKEMINTESSEFEVPSVPEHSEDYDFIVNKDVGDDQQDAGLLLPNTDSKGFVGDSSAEENVERSMGCETDSKDTILSSDTVPENEPPNKEQCQGALESEPPNREQSQAVNGEIIVGSKGSDEEVIVGRRDADDGTNRHSEETPTQVVGDEVTMGESEVVGDGFIVHRNDIPAAHFEGVVEGDSKLLHHVGGS